MGLHPQSAHGTFLLPALPMLGTRVTVAYPKCMTLLKHMGVLNQSFLDEFFTSYHGLKSKMTAAKLSFLTVLNKSDGLGSSRAEPGESGPDIHFLI